MSLRSRYFSLRLQTALRATSDEPEFWFARATALFLQGLVSDAPEPRFHRLEIAPQFSAVLSDLIARFTTLERGEQRVCKVAPRNPQQFLQSINSAV
jgi:hypothetical protein